MDEQTRRLVEGAEARASKATPGPWACRPSVGSDGEECDDIISKTDGNRTIASGIDREEAIGFDDSDFIAHARTDVPALCAKVRELDAALESKHRFFARIGNNTVHIEAAGTDSAQFRVVTQAHGSRTTCRYDTESEALTDFTHRVSMLALQL